MRPSGVQSDDIHASNMGLGPAASSAYDALKAIQVNGVAIAGSSTRALTVDTWETRANKQAEHLTVERIGNGCANISKKFSKPHLQQISREVLAQLKTVLGDLWNQDIRNLDNGSPVRFSQIGAAPAGRHWYDSLCSWYDWFSRSWWYAPPAGPHSVVIPPAPAGMTGMHGGHSMTAPDGPHGVATPPAPAGMTGMSGSVGGMTTPDGPRGAHGVPIPPGPHGMTGMNGSVGGTPSPAPPG